jgi:hypothetical protein
MSQNRQQRRQAAKTNPVVPQPQSVDINSLSLLELKGLYYDLKAQEEHLGKQASMVNQQIAIKTQEMIQQRNQPNPIPEELAKKPATPAESAPVEN